MLNLNASGRWQRRNEKVRIYIIEYVAVLTGVTVVSVALLAWVNELTKEPIAQANAKALNDAVNLVIPGFDNDPIAEKKMQEVNGVGVCRLSCH